VAQSYTWAARGRWIGMKAGGVRWHVRKTHLFCLRSMAGGVHFIEPIRTPPNRPSWKLTNWRLPILAACSGAALRQLEERGKENPAGSSTGGDGAIYRVSFALGFESEFCAPARGTRKAAWKAKAAVPA